MLVRKAANLPLLLTILGVIGGLERRNCERYAMVKKDSEGC